MATVKPKTTIQFKMDGECVSHARTDVSVRDVEVTIDEPEARGGTNMGLSPTETLMAALLGCTSVISHRIAHEAGFDIDPMSVDCDASFDRRGVMLTDEVEVPFPKVVLNINITTSAGDAEIEMLKTHLSRFCPVSKVIRASGTEIEEVWNVTRV